jgi:hypothetical protein
MMTPLLDAQRKQGGDARAENQTGADKRFLATLAASRRPLKNDVHKTDDELLGMFREMSRGGPGGGGDRKWIIFLMVGADCRTIRSTLDDRTILQRMKIVGGVIGFMGVTVFGSPHKGGRAPSLQVYYKPLKAGNAVIEKLDRASRAVTAAVIAAIKPLEGSIGTEVGR